MTKLIPVWWTVVAGLFAALVSVVGTSYAAGRQLAVLERVGPALDLLAHTQTRLAVVEATCCGERRTAHPHPVPGGHPWALAWIQ